MEASPTRLIKIPQGDVGDGEWRPNDPYRLDADLILPNDILAIGAHNHKVIPVARSKRLALTLQRQHQSTKAPTLAGSREKVDRHSAGFAWRRGWAGADGVRLRCWRQPRSPKTHWVREGNGIGEVKIAGTVCHEAGRRSSVGADLVGA